jgi:primosomal protein N' (replication factor Y)
MDNGESLSYEYASVYLLDNPYCIDATYDYYIPLPMRAEVHAGVFVTVPFGRGNRKQMAIVRSLSHCPDYKDIKSIAEICADRGELSEEMLSLCDYMKEQYLCTYGEAVRCVLPASALGKMIEYYRPTESGGPDASSGFSPADLFVYDYVRSGGGRSLEMIKAKFGAAVAEPALKKLSSKGYVAKDMVAAKKVNDAFSDHYSLAVSQDECLSILSGGGKIKLRSEKHKAILRFLMESEGDVPADKLCAECAVASTQLKALLDKGLVSVEKKRVWREAFDANEAVADEIILNDEQTAAYNTVKERIESGEASAVLLHGVTGSGKTSVIIRAIDTALDNGRGVIMLLPEIALTPQTLKIFSSRYGKRIALVHSGLSAGERYDSYMKIRSGEADLVVGTRSAIFSPVKNLGLVVIDEEHETTYKSETDPKYHARDIARWRCAKSQALLLLASATPSVESYTKAVDGKYTLVKLRERYGGAELREVVIYDMRNEPRLGNVSPVGDGLKRQLISVTEKGEQAILFLNRRGYNTSVGCKSCGENITCPRCSISMNYHTKKGDYENGFLFCHWCGYKARMPRVCPTCSSEHLVKIGYGTQRIEQEIGELLPDKKIIRMDADSTAAKNSLDALLSEFKDGGADVLLGTQMVTKGHDFPNVTLVGVLLADMSLYMDDYHANERTFSMLTQVIGRAGRSKKKGVAIIQTNNPDNDTIRLACKQDYEAFYASEIRLRKLLVFPPYCDIALMTLTCSDEKQVIIGAKRLREEIDRLSRGEFSDVEMMVFGPFESPVYKVEEKYRMRMVIKCRLNKRSRALFSTLLTDFGNNSRGKAALSIDFNPTGL